MTAQNLNGGDDMSLAELARDLLENTFSGKATLDDIALVIIGDHHDVFVASVYKTFKNQIRKALTKKDSTGLPWASSLDDAGTYIQRRLFDPTAYVTVVNRYVRLGASDITVARRFAEECFEVHGVAIDVNSMVAAAVAS